MTRTKRDQPATEPAEAAAASSSNPPPKKKRSEKEKKRTWRDWVKDKKSVERQDLKASVEAAKLDRLKPGTRPYKAAVKTFRDTLIGELGQETFDLVTKALDKNVSPQPRLVFDAIVWSDELVAVR